MMFVKYSLSLISGVCFMCTYFQIFHPFHLDHHLNPVLPELNNPFLLVFSIILPVVSKTFGHCVHVHTDHMLSKYYLDSDYVRKCFYILVQFVSLFTPTSITCCLWFQYDCLSIFLSSFSSYSVQCLLSVNHPQAIFTRIDM